MTFAAIAAFLNTYDGPLLKWLKSHWRTITWFLFLIVSISCVLRHCGGVRIPYLDGDIISGKPDTTMIRDTFFVDVDTNAIFKLHGFDTLPDYVVKLESRKWDFDRPDFTGAESSSDSVDVLKVVLAMCDSLLTECDSLFRENTALRVYNETIENDSIRLHINMKLRGKLEGEPSFIYNRLTPQMVIHDSIFIKQVDTLVVGPKSEIYVGGGVGPRFQWDGNGFSTMAASVETGWRSKKGWSFGGRFTASHRDYDFQVVIRKGFSLK